MNVINRLGIKIEFDRNRIVNALKKAFNACEYDYDEKQIDEIIKEIKIWDEMNIEDIQDQIEEILLFFGYEDVSKEYALYRKDRAIIRKNKDKLLKDISEKLEARNVQNQNANIDETSFGGRIGEATRVVTKDYALNYCMSSMSKENHLNNEIYIHDLDSYAAGMHNCLSLPIDDLLANGVITRQCDIRPAGSVNTAFQLVAVYFQIQSLQQFGRNSAC